MYEGAGSFELKGKEGLTTLWRAQRVVSGRQGSLKSQGLEAPFVGRDRELQRIKELFHASADEKKAQLVSVTGIAGIGKSRLAGSSTSTSTASRRPSSGTAGAAFLRRGGGLLGAGGHGADALPDRRGGGAGVRA